ncbi:hypothetical protein CR983_04080 [Candidatus Saccharibacteria bacterium]|nr:MAG: hypothetical protein CR983_04080 [Candidatus Saccharibacteria bacterium]
MRMSGKATVSSSAVVVERPLGADETTSATLGSKRAPTAIAGAAMIDTVFVPRMIGPFYTRVAAVAVTPVIVALCGADATAGSFAEPG